MSPLASKILKICLQTVGMYFLIFALGQLSQGRSVAGGYCRVPRNPCLLTEYYGCVVRIQLHRPQIQLAQGIRDCLFPPSPYPRMRYQTGARPSSSWQRSSHIYNLLAGAESLSNGTLFPSMKAATQTNNKQTNTRYGFIRNGVKSQLVQFLIFTKISTIFVS